MSYLSEVLADNPTVYYRLGETSGTVAFDSSGNTTDAAYAGTPTLGVPSLLLSDPDTAVQFDGVDDRVSLAATANVAAVTVEAWVKTSTTTGTMFIAGRNTSTAGQLLAGLDLVNGIPRFSVQNTLNTVFTASGSVSIANGATHHLVGTFSINTVLLYVDGTQVGSATLTGTFSGSVDSPYVIGGITGLSQFFTGVIDEVAVYGGKALTAARVSAHYAAGISTAPVQARNAAEWDEVLGTATTAAAQNAALLATVLGTVPAAESRNATLWLEVLGSPVPASTAEARLSAVVTQIPMLVDPATVQARISAQVTQVPMLLTPSNTDGRLSGLVAQVVLQVNYGYVTFFDGTPVMVWNGAQRCYLRIT